MGTTVASRTPPLPELAIETGKAIKCVAPDGSESHLAPVPLYGCSETIWLEWMDRDSNPHEIELFDGVWNRVRNYDSKLVPIEETRFEHKPRY